MDREAFLSSLARNPLRQALLHHPFFDHVATMPLDRAQVAGFLGQYWYPISYFPEFLARTVAVLPTTELKTQISKILYQELGEGEVERAHENLYRDTMVDAGFAEADVTAAPMTEATRRLMEGYHRSSARFQSALGFVYGTEIIDMRIVSGLGAAVTAASGKDKLPWVEIHVEQEPEHVRKARHAVRLDFSADDMAEIVENAEEIWRLWDGFFAGLLASWTAREAA
jgi:pyrroloquinoline quinone (PQQ) biosynthesis protein C